ncbi:hypothetical protein HWB90_gp012 [Mycobacterium phage Fowlmouth]|uniref:Uncharacterized protein n=2 Tax=Fowlmouthvirus fowlmouth TaxID=2845652 RepID=A0A7G8LPQ5_9CAUD|nr:hypothetical protein HWB90_gp012 [Mycobacterium phage Fowlmouth]AYN57962.1 hypothetical protein SEA_FOWLMOUTH_12 [Mycobacterium phage Fowlmouth]QNJ59227.1 hypothetical protein SEA_MRMIYAGI_12 [Mycobacterium phage MrMiyagi]
MSISPAQVATVKMLLPTAAVEDYGWTDEFIENLMETRGFGATQAVRFFWLQRVNETVEYLDINDKPLTQIHRQAKEMLAYWDEVLKGGPEAIEPNTRSPISFGEIERPEGYVRSR